MTVEKLGGWVGVGGGGGHKVIFQHVVTITSLPIYIYYLFFGKYLGGLSPPPPPHGPYRRYGYGLNSVFVKIYININK